MQCAVHAAHGRRGEGSRLGVVLHLHQRRSGGAAARVHPRVLRRRAPQPADAAAGPAAAPRLLRRLLLPVSFKLHDSLPARRILPTVSASPGMQPRRFLGSHRDPARCRAPDCRPPDRLRLCRAWAALPPDEYRTRSGPEQQQWCAPYAYKQRSALGCGGADKWRIVPGGAFPTAWWPAGSGSIYWWVTWTSL